MHGLPDHVVVTKFEKVLLEGVFCLRPKVGVFHDPRLERLGLRVRHGAVQFVNP
jgi:hypothetical protein